MSRTIYRDNVIKMLDDVIPPHAYREASPHRRLWTTSGGQFHLRVTVDSATFTVAERSWDVCVPLTIEGLDALVVAMVLAKSVDAPAPFVKPLAEVMRSHASAYALIEGKS